MQTKSSYRVLKWTFMIGAVASLATACVVTSGDGDDDDDFGEGGEGGSTTTAGKTSTAGSTSTSGKTSTGGGGSSSTAGSTAAGGEGGEASGYVPGQCQADDPTPTMLPSCELNADDMKADFACRKCLKSKACDDWQTCFGDAPTTACGSGPTEDADGQFECIRGCALDDMSGDDIAMVLGRCEGMCLLQCEAKDTDGFALTDTQALLGTAQDECLTECFSP
jgi:hypothetical protein